MLPKHAMLLHVTQGQMLHHAQQPGCFVSHAYVCACWLQVLLCEETVSLLGIRQYYQLVDTSSSNGVDAPPAAELELLTTAADGDEAVAAVDDNTPAAADSSKDASSSTGVDTAAAAASSDGEPQQKQHQLSIKEQQQLLLLKVDALLQLLSTVSFHQVGLLAIRNSCVFCCQLAPANLTSDCV
jgi:hypothetical protein